MEIERRRHQKFARFLDSFFDEHSLRWLFAIGVVILLGSSLMLVRATWREYTPIWKYVTVFAYTVVMFACGRLASTRLALPRTGTALLALTVLLLPVSFFALRWVGEEPGLGSLALPVALAFQLAAGGLMAREVFRWLLRGDQPTFLASYLALCAAAAVVPGLDTAWAPWAGLALWAVATAGSVKVTRHVFWLGESGRRPRIFGLFPQLLLAAQLLALSAVWLLPALEWDWIGLAAVLLALTITLNADSVLRVFERRTGGLVRPLPAGIILALGLGVVLTVGGVIVSALGPALGKTAYPLVPAAAAAALVMALAARDTRRAVFVWGALIAVMTAYEFSPVFFRELRDAVVTSAAAAVREDSLPKAFYGLTYLPLLAAVGVAGRFARRTRVAFVERPARQFSVGLAVLLLLGSFTHVKAIFPVGLALTALFSAQARLFADRRIAPLAVLAWLAAAAGAAPFASKVLELPVSDVAAVSCVAAAALALLAASGRLDRASRRLAGGPEAAGATNERHPAVAALIERPCRAGSLAATALLVPAALLGCLLDGFTPEAVIGAALVAALLAMQALAHAGSRELSWLGDAALVFPAAAGVVLTLDAGASAAAAIAGVSVFLAALRVARPGVARLDGTRLAQAFLGPLRRVSGAGAVGGLALVCLPLLALEAVAVLDPGTADERLIVDLWLPGCALLVLAAFDVARAERSAIPGVVAALAVHALAAVAFLRGAGAEAGDWVPAVWSATTLAGVVMLGALRRRAREMGDAGGAGAPVVTPAPIAVPVQCVLEISATLVTALSLLVLTWPLRIAALIAMAALLAAGRLGSATGRRLGLALVNWHLFCALLGSLALEPGAKTIFGLDFAALRAASPWLAGLAGVSLGAWALAARGEVVARLVALLQRLGLRVAAALALLASLSLETPGAPALVAAGVGFAGLIAAEVLSACRLQDARRAWSAEGVLLAAVLFFWYFKVITFGRGISLYVMLAAAIAFGLLGRLAARRDATRVLADPFTTTAMWLPLATAVVGLVRHLMPGEVRWPGFRSLALLLAAGFYFWRGVDGRRRGLVVIAAGILNAALIMLWRDLTWTDPQLFTVPIGLTVIALVELLRKEIPARLHDPLRYAGALTILVSPVFNILFDFDGSWIPFFTLMACSVGVILLAIGLRARVLLYSGAAFLLADLVAMVVRGSIDHPSLLWIAGLALGSLVLALAAVCEYRREELLQRLRALGAAMEAWK